MSLSNFLPSDSDPRTLTQMLIHPCYKGPDISELSDPKSDCLVNLGTKCDRDSLYETEGPHN